MKYLCKMLSLSIVVLFVVGCGSPKDVVIEVSAPLSVVKGDSFEIVVKVTNTASKSQKLASIDIADSYLKGIYIGSTKPSYTDVMHVPLDNTMSYTFNKNIEAGQTVKVVFSASALERGDYIGEADICINTTFSFLSRSMRTVVE